MSGGGGGSIRPDTLAANNFSTAYNSDSIFAQKDAKFIFQSNYILLIMIRLIAFKLLQIKCTALDFRFLTDFKIKKQPANFLFS